MNLGFEDITLVPRYSNVGSRSQVDLNVEYETKYSEQKISGFPLIISNMTCVGQMPVELAAREHDCFTALHKFYSEEKLIKHTRDANNKAFISTGITKLDFEKIKKVNEEQPITRLRVDVANGYLSKFLKALEKYRKLLPKTIIFAGNIATKEGVFDIVNAGADGVVAGLANGQRCKTKNVTGINLKQFSTVEETAEAARYKGALLCSDGGCREPGDVCKALAAGAHFVMVGSMFMACDECTESEWENGKMLAYGMSSEYANEKFAGGLKEYRAAEGDLTWLDSKGPFKKIIQELKGGVASCCTYSDCKQLSELHSKAIIRK